MDNLIAMDVNVGQEAGSFACGYGGDGRMPSGVRQDAYAVPGQDPIAGFIQDAELLRHCPFEEGAPESGFQGAAPAEADFNGVEESLPVPPAAPAMGQELEDYGEPEAEVEGYCMDGGAQEEPDDEISDEEALQEDKSVENSADKAAEEDRERAEHEASEAKRKAEWEARMQAKRDAEALQMAKLSALTEEELAAEAMKRIGADTEKLTRRNMKDCVSEYIQTLCLEDTAFARLAMHPRKTMVHCFRYINRKAREFVEQEMKDNDIKPENGIYGSDVPDGLCYQWAEDYFRDPDAEEDRKKEEKFVPKPYTGKAPAKSKSQKAESKKSAKKKDKSGEAAKAGTKAPEKASGQRAMEKKEDGGQISFMEQMSLGDFSFQEEKAG